jgi:cell division transport system permease protein
MLLAATFALALQAASSGLSQATAGRLLVQVVDADAKRREATADAVLSRLDNVPGVDSAHRVPDTQAKALIAPYIAGMNATDLPVPAMIDVRGDRARVTQALQDIPTVVLTATGDEVAPLSRLIEALRAVAFGTALVAAAATAMIAALSARAVLSREASTLEILHALGATDGQLSRLVTGRIARDAVLGSLVGLLAALLVMAGLSSRIAALATGIEVRLGPAAWLILLVLPALLVMLTIAAAQATLVATLRRAP